MTALRAPFEIADFLVEAGERKLIHLPLAALSNNTPMSLPVWVFHGRKKGPVLFVSAAVHGDELTGVGVCHRLLTSSGLRIVRGTLLVVPIVNAFGFIGHTRYLPDGRDLNRTFPGSAKGSLAARLANLFFREVVLRADFGIDLHSAALHRENLPQLRIDCSDEKALELAQAFGPPVILHAGLREGSLRHVGRERGIPIIVYEAGEGLRFDKFAVRMGEAGVLRVLSHLGMIQKAVRPATQAPVATGSTWARAPASGLFRPDCETGDHVSAGQKIGIIADAYGDGEIAVRAIVDGLIIGRSNMPAVNEGDPLFNIARIAGAEAIGAEIDRLEELVTAEALSDEDEVV